jgi:hypothetical protein
MSTAQHQGIRASGQEGLEIAGQQGAGPLPLQIPGFDALHQAGTGLGQNLGATVIRHQMRELLAGQGLAGGQYPHHPRATPGHRWLEGGLHGDHGHRVTGAQQPGRRAGGGIAGHHQSLGVTSQQKFGDGDGAGLNGCQGLVTIGGMRRIRHV